MNKINFKRLIGILLCMTMIISGTALAFATDLDEPVTVNSSSVKYYKNK